MSVEGSVEECRVEVVMEDKVKEAEDSVTYFRLGVDHPVETKGTDMVIQCGRVRDIEGLDQCTQLTKLCLIANNVNKIQGLDNLVNLEHLEFYQNCIGKIENISHLTKLKVLDLSFNEIRRLEGVETLTNLTRLYVSSNKIKTICNIESLVELELLEVGSNRVSAIEGVHTLTKLKELWLGKNKITSMAIPYLPELRSLSIQSNRLEQWDASVFACPNLQHLYLSNNNLPDIPNFPVARCCLTTLDLAYNSLTRLGVITTFTTLQELCVCILIS
eukprot:GHVR01047226.1.p1 GENE.GHVR01047226.1~~GHVR01047226.1.p1  ORF type:complete len:274 (+),score=48.46 GHVR01047226.1:41-862(+)